MKYCCFIICCCAIVQLTAQPAPPFDSLQISFSDTLYFASGSDVLEKEALERIISFPSPILDTDRLYLSAHTDDVGDAVYNDALANRRAGNAQTALNSRGWNEENTLIRTFGERKPIATNAADQGRQRNRRVTLGIYRAVPYVKVKGRAIDPAGEGIDHAIVRIHGRTIADTLFTDQEGRFDLDLPIDSVVGIDVYAKDYFLSTQIIRVEPNIDKDLLIEVKPAEPGAVADIANFYFVGNQAVLLPQSEPELPKLKLFLEINPHLVIEIAGHVNFPNNPPVLKSSNNWDLSVRRAKMVYDYLITEGIPAQQLSFEGYGNHQMRFPNANTEIRQAANRRVEIRVVSTTLDHR